ncbi:MAG: hypothetical protein V2I62_09345 [Bacteroidales bacterium]|nr:hypothetical protein [Bacteroidales bacterium]
MNNLSFNIKNTRDLYNKLNEDYKEYSDDRLSSRKALNFAFTAWHLSDWIYNEFNNKLKVDYNNLYSFQSNLKKLCPSLQFMHDLTNGTKHYTLTKHNPRIKDTNLHIGDFNDDFNRDFDISMMVIKLEDGTRVCFEDEIKIVMNFWTKYLKETIKMDL